MPTGLAGILIDILTLQFLPFALRGFVAASVGVALVAFGAAGYWLTSAGVVLGGRVLDAGCGQGFFADAADETRQKGSQPGRTPSSPGSRCRGRQGGQSARQCDARPP